MVLSALGLLFFKINTWGYSTINFFAPMSRYASDGGGPLNASREFKEMVKALHGAGIEVYCDFSSPKSKICFFFFQKIKYVIFLVDSNFLFVVSLVKSLKYLL
jgi:hypothetical protein